MKMEQASKKEMKELHSTLKEIVYLHEKQKKPTKIKIRGRYLWIFPKVFNPKYGNASTLLLKHLKFKKGSTVLDVGTGSGIYAIFSVYNGASKAVATDMSPYAIKCAEKNIKMHDMETKIEVRKGDMFSHIGKDEKFDVIIANLPFFRRENFKFKETYIDRFFVDENGRLMDSFLYNSRKHLKKKGKIMMVYGISGFVNKLLRLIKKYRFRYKILDTKDCLSDRFYILELKRGYPSLAHPKPI